MKLPRFVRLPVLLASLSILVIGSLRAVAAPASDVVPGEMIICLKTNPYGISQIAGQVGSVAGHQPALNAFRIRLLPGIDMARALEHLRQRPDVLYAEPIHILHAYATPNDGYYAAYQYAPQITQANLSWDIWQPRARVTIGVIDTGIDATHPDLSGSMLRDASGAIVGWNVQTGTANAQDDYGHGTHVAGIAAAQINNGTGIAGIAGWNPSVTGSNTYIKLMPVKVLDNTGSGTDANVADGIVWAADHGAKVITMSLGGPSYSSTLNNAVQYAWNKGCVIVAAAGNDGTSAYSYPAAYQHVIAVAATDNTDTLTSFSNYGSWVTVAAPGNSILSTTPTYATTFPTNYAYASGTSMATPHVAGEAAAILAMNPGLTNASVNNIILANVDGYKPYSTHTLASGAGRINVYRAIQATASTLTSSTLAPAAPTGLKATASSTQISLSWTASTGASSYNIKRSTSAGGPFTTLASAASTAYTDSAVTAGTTYYYVVSAVNSSGESANSSVASATVPVPVPATPTGLQASASSTQVALSWIASSGATSYHVKRSTTSGGPYTTLATVTAASYADTTVTAGTTYYYVVSALNASGESANSNAVSVSVPVAVPTAPTGLQASASSTQVALSWSAVSGATSYHVKRSTTSGGPYTTLASATSTGYADTAVSAGATYYYVVSAVNSSGESANSSQAAATVPAPAPAPAPVPAAPTGLAASASSTQAALTWTASSGASSYHIKRSTTSGGPYTTLASPTSTSYTDTAVTAGTTYYYVVSALNASGESANSTQASATVPAPTPTPAPGQTTLKINSGGPAYTSSTLGAFSADQYFTGGSAAQGYYQMRVLGTYDPMLYWTYRQGTSFSYNLPATNGNYTLKLHLAEMNLSVQPGQRVFSVSVNGQVALAKVDPRATAGTYYAVADQSVPVTVSNGTLTVTFTSLAGSAYPAEVNAIELVPAQ